MLINEVEKNPRPYIIKHIEPLAAAKNRMRKLGIGEAYRHLMKWIYTGLFKANPGTMDQYANVFYAIRSVLPPEVVQSYGNLPRLYRGVVLKSKEQLYQINSGGLPMKSQISAWTPDKRKAGDYAREEIFGGKPGVVLRHHAAESEVVLAFNSPTMEYLRIDPRLVANPREVILSLSDLAITPKMVEKVYA